MSYTLYKLQSFFGIEQRAQVLKLEVLSLFCFAFDT